MGVTQHTKGGRDDTGHRQSCIFFADRSAKPVPGLCPVRGHSNVQGDRTMGIWEKVKEEFCRRPRKGIRFCSAAERKALAPSNAIAAMNDCRVKVFFAMGGNFLSADAGHGDRRRCFKEMPAYGAGGNKTESN